MVEPTEFRAGQRTRWNTAAGGWKKWSELTDKGGAVISRRLVELAGVEPGSRVLDVACGYGEPALTAARAAGPHGRVVGSDISAEMLAFGRERAAAAGIDNIEFIEASADSLDFPAGSFDAAVSRWGIIFEPEGEQTATRVRSFLQPGGRFAIASWGTPERVPFLSIPLQTVTKLLDAEPPPAGTPGPLSRPTPDAIGGLLEGGGFNDVMVEEATATFEWESPESYTTYVREISPPISAMIAPHPPAVQEQAWQAITEAARVHADADGRVEMSNLVLMASGTA